jgi:AAA family ATP:ADP antiporter
VTARETLARLGRAAGVLGGEEKRVGWGAGLLFCIFASWYLLRPMRDAMGVAGGTKDLPRLFLITLAATLALTPIVSQVVSWLPRRSFLSLAYRVLAGTLVVFFLILRGSSPSVLGARIFFVWASVFNLLEVTLAWGLLADVFSREQGVRLFAVVGAGGTLGAMVGSLLATVLLPAVGVAPTLLAAALLLEGAVRCVHRLDAEARRQSPARAGVVGPTRALAWLRHAATSGYWLGICAYMTLFTVTSTVLYLEQGRIVQAAVVGTAARASIFARMDLAVNVLTLLLQISVVGRAVRAIGVGTALAILPLATLACFVSLRFAPVLAVLVACQVSRRVVDFAVTRPAREVLFTTARSDDKYKAKSFVDTFIYRSGDAIGAAGFEGVRGPVVLAAMAVVCFAWATLGVVLGRARPTAR